MIFSFVIDNTFVADDSFLEFKYKIAAKFWTNEKQHNYKQIVYWMDGKTIIPVKTENDFDILCEDLEEQINMMMHMAFIPKHHITNIHSDINEEHAVPFYKNISCKGCGIQPIIGTLYMCFEACRDFHLCEVCESDKHHSEHMMFVVPRSTTTPHLQQLQPRTGIHCYNCGLKPIIGFLYKCILCDNRFFCENCTSYKSVPCKNHGMIRFPDSGGQSATGTAVSQANVQSAEDRQFKVINNNLDQVLEVITSGGINIADSTVLQEVKTGSKEVNRTIYKAD